MANFDWNKLKQALASREWIALLVLAWMLSIPLYIILQIWFGYAWAGRWRIAALIPLIGLALGLIVIFVAIPHYPEQLGPVQDSLDRLLAAAIADVAWFFPLGFIYLAIAGIARFGRQQAGRELTREHGASVPVRFGSVR